MTARPAGSAATYCPGRRGGSRIAKDLVVDGEELVGRSLVRQEGDGAGVGADNDVVAGLASDADRRDGADHAERRDVEQQREGVLW